VSQEQDILPSEETAWIESAQKGDRAAFAKIVDLYWDRLFRWLINITRDRNRAEDLAQETFLKALTALKSFQAGTNFRAWLFRIAHNNFVNLKRSEKRTKLSLKEDTPSTDINAERNFEDREAIAAVNTALESLSEDFRAALLLHVQEGLAYREVAKIVNTTEETARWRVYKARQKLLSLIPAELLPHDKKND
jgi:RNA polymerase sigma-70 factor, ECF subfamily